MKSAKQVVFVCIGVAMVLLSLGLIFMKKANDTAGGSTGGESGTVIYKGTENTLLSEVADDNDNIEVEDGEKNGTEVFTGEVNSLVFEAGACNIEVETGAEDTYTLSYEGLKYGKLTHRLENGELKISYKQNDNWMTKMFSANDINDQKITLTVPKNVVLESALFEFGAADIEMDRIAAKELYITVGAGELKASSLTATELAKFNVGAGAFYADGVELANADLVCGVGEMELSGTITGESKADCGVGSMKLTLDGEQDTYYGELNCGLGDLRFGSVRIDGSGKESYGTSSAENRMDIKCGIGEVDVRFH